jgi:hypothetical protein
LDRRTKKVTKLEDKIAHLEHQIQQLQQNLENSNNGIEDLKSKKASSDYVSGSSRADRKFHKLELLQTKVNSLLDEEANCLDLRHLELLLQQQKLANSKVEATILEVKYLVEVGN